jgi:hypothetical protein
MANQTIGKSRDLLLGLFKVTIQAPTHVHASGGARDRHLPDISMAVLAIKTGKHMRLVAKEDVIRHFDHSLPGYWLLLLPVVEHCLHFAPIRGDHGMTSDTTLNRRYSGHIGPHGIGVAKEALNPSFIVEVVAKSNRLIRCGLRCSPR